MLLDMDALLCSDEEPRDFEAAPEVPITPTGAQVDDGRIRAVKRGTRTK
jgi:hypothetical protein